MEKVMNDLKARARILHMQVRSQEPSAVERLRNVPELAALSSSELARAAQRKHCLGVIARELGLDGWPHLVAVAEGGEVSHFGSLLYTPACSSHWNIWSASYEEARAIREQHGGYLLPYKHQFMVVDRHFVETLGLDPEAPEWTAMGRDWARPASSAARDRLCRTLLVSREHGSIEQNLRRRRA